MSLRRMRQTGDTIVEVLICLAIIGGTLTISYSVARRSLFQIRSSQERQEMLGLAQTQIERVKQYIAVNGISGIPVAPTPFCIEELSDAAHTLFVRKDTDAIPDPRNTVCAVNGAGEYWNGGNTYDNAGSRDDTNLRHNTTASLPVVEAVDVKFPYRAAMLYRKDSSTLSKTVNEFYAFGGRYGAGGYGNSANFSIVPLMYRQTP